MRRITLPKIIHKIKRNFGSLTVNTEELNENPDIEVNDDLDQNLVDELQNKTDDGANKRGDKFNNTGQQFTDQIEDLAQKLKEFTLDYDGNEFEDELNEFEDNLFGTESAQVANKRVKIRTVRTSQTSLTILSRSKIPVTVFRMLPSSKWTRASTSLMAISRTLTTFPRIGVKTSVVQPPSSILTGTYDISTRNLTV